MKMTLERIPAADLPQKIHQGQPAIVTDLFRGRPIERIIDLQQAREMLGEMKVTISLNYIDGHLERIRRYLRGVPTPPKLGKTVGTFAAYLDLVARDPDSRYVISEEPTPEGLLKNVDLSEFGIDTLISGNPAPFAEVPPTTSYSLIFAANRGNSSDMHADGDGRDVLLFQGFGRKRVILFPPESAPHLHPIATFSTVRFAGMSDAERHDFVAYAGGVEHTLLPGETIFMPAFIWHHFDYLEPALSVIFRFGGITDPDAKAALRAVHLDQHVQNIIAGTRDPARAEACRSAARRLLLASKQEYKSTQAKYRVMRVLAAECHMTTRPPDAGSYPRGIVEAEDFLDGGLSGFYSQPPNGSAMRRSVWRVQERLRDMLRRWGRRLSYWA